MSPAVRQDEPSNEGLEPAPDSPTVEPAPPSDVEGDVDASADAESLAETDLSSAEGIGEIVEVILDGMQEWLIDLLKQNSYVAVLVLYSIPFMK